MNTIEEAKAYLRENLEKGVSCPCCKQLVKQYDYSLNVSIAHVLIQMYHLHREGQEWVHVNTEVKKSSGGYFSLAKHWDLIKQKMLNENEDKRVSGYWKLTTKGTAFVENRITVPKQVVMYDGRILAFSDENISIGQALGKKFSYSELMGVHFRNNTPTDQPKQTSII